MLSWFHSSSFIRGRGEPQRRLSEPPQTDHDLLGRIASDIKGSGFPLEIETGSFLSNRGWNVAHQALFRDADENKSRNIDIIARKLVERPFGRFSRLNYTLICECKKSEKPWVFYAPPTTVLKEKGLALLTFLKIVSKPAIPVPGPSFYHTHYVAEGPLDRIGQAHHVPFTKPGQSKSNGYDQVYSATSQVLKAMLFNLGNLRKILREPSAPTAMMILYPLIVLDGKMFQYTVNEVGGPSLEGTDYVKYKTSYLGSFEFVEEEEFLIDIITRSFLPGYIDLVDAEMARFLAG